MLGPPGVSVEPCGEGSPGQTPHTQLGRKVDACRAVDQVCVRRGLHPALASGCQAHRGPAVRGAEATPGVQGSPWCQLQAGTGWPCT